MKPDTFCWILVVGCIALALAAQWRNVGIECYAVWCKLYGCKSKRAYRWHCCMGPLALHCGYGFPRDPAVKIEIIMGKVYVNGELPPIYSYIK